MSVCDATWDLSRLSPMLCYVRKVKNSQARTGHNVALKTKAYAKKEIFKRMKSPSSRQGLLGLTGPVWRRCSSAAASEPDHLCPRRLDHRAPHRRQRAPRLCARCGPRDGQRRAPPARTGAKRHRPLLMAGVRLSSATPQCQMSIRALPDSASTCSSTHGTLAPSQAGPPGAVLPMVLLHDAIAEVSSHGETGPQHFRCAGRDVPRGPHPPA